MTEENKFDLSEKIFETEEDKLEVVGVWDVKEFIRRLKESWYSGLSKKELFAKIDKLAGARLK